MSDSTSATSGQEPGATTFITMEHGAGQSYSGDPRSARHGSYAGGTDRDDTGLFLVPNEQAADRWRVAYPTAGVSVIGSPRLDALPEREPGPGPVVALGFHWPCAIAPEARTAFPHYRSVIPSLARRFRLLGHGHPRFMPRLASFYRSAGIEPVEDFGEVLRRADLYVCDNSSTLFEFAATERPVVVLNAPWYRREVHHGLRFWDAATVGLQVHDPAELAGTIADALADHLAQRVERDDLREYVETALPDTALERILAACELAIAQWAGPLEVDPYEGTVEDVTETVSAPGRALLLLRQAPTAITGVVDVHGGIESELDESGYRTEGRYLRRLAMALWGERTAVTYTPFDDSPVRRTVLIQLVQLELDVQPGMAAQGAGPWSETYGKYLRQRNELLRAIRPADPPVPRSVPYATARI